MAKGKHGVLHLLWKHNFLTIETKKFREADLFRHGLYNFTDWAIILWYYVIHKPWSLIINSSADYHHMKIAHLLYSRIGTMHTLHSHNDKIFNWSHRVPFIIMAVCSGKEHISPSTSLCKMNSSTGSARSLSFYLSLSSQPLFAVGKSHWWLYNFKLLGFNSKHMYCCSGINADGQYDIHT